MIHVLDPHSHAVNQRQRRYLVGLVGSSFDGPKPVQHDFACGVGRGIGMLHDLVSDAHGYDVSRQMLDRAERQGHQAHWHVIDATGPTPVAEAVDGPAIVTVLRLLLNVPDDVRDRAVGFAATALESPDAGLLVVENHGARRSLRHLRAHKHANNPWYAELSDQQVYDIFGRHGFELVARKGCAIFPRGWYRPKLTRTIMRRIDDLLCATRIFDRYAVDVLYVARRAPAQETQIG